MRDLIKKYWDIFGGVTAGLTLSFIAKFKLEKIQLVYSIIILILVSIGVLKIVKQTIEKQQLNKFAKKRKKTLIDKMVDGQKPVKAINLAQEPTKEGERIGNLLIDIMKGLKKIMEKLKVLFDKFKGIILSLMLGVLTIIEMCGGFINDLFGGVLEVNGIDVLPVITLGASVIVGIISNGYTSEQKKQIKALFTKSTTDKMVLEEIKKTLKDNEAKKKDYTKILTTKENELANLQSELETATNTHKAKKEMFSMVPQLATEQDVEIACERVNEVTIKIDTKKVEIEETKAKIANLQTTINALKSQL